MFGDIDIQKIQLNQGSLNLSGLTCSVKELNAVDNTSLIIKNAAIDSLNTSSLSHGVSLTSDSAIIRVVSPAQFTWNNLYYAGTIDVAAGSLQMNATDSIASLHCRTASTAIRRPMHGNAAARKERYGLPLDRHGAAPNHHFANDRLPHHPAHRQFRFSGRNVAKNEN